jgi:hypothetical protein
MHPNEPNPLNMKKWLAKVVELAALYPTLDHYHLMEVFLVENRNALNRKKPNFARTVAVRVMARYMGMKAKQDALKRTAPNESHDNPRRKPPKSRAKK